MTQPGAISGPRSPDRSAGPVEQLDSVTIRFAGDSGDGMQLAGSQFSTASASLGNDVSTLPDFPAEIRAPAGTLAGVSGFQVHIASTDIFTPGDELDCLVAMNPAALKTNLDDLRVGGILIVNTDAFTAVEWLKAGYRDNPLDEPSLSRFRLLKVPITTLNRQAVAPVHLGTREADRCKNLFSLGLVDWLFDRPLESTRKWLRDKFSLKPDVLEANIRALEAGYHFGETAELLPVQYRVPQAKLPPGIYRKITGNEAIALGLVAACDRAGLDLVYSSYPITPASDILHRLTELRSFGVRAVQAEDEVAAVGMAIGASFGGAVGATGTSGPGFCLKAEAINLAVMAELPLVVINVQRGGPSTGLPTKTEQADLLQAIFGRNGESPLAVIAPSSPADCFAIAFEAVRIATRYMTPVILLSDGFLANGAEPWAVPSAKDLARIAIEHPPARIGVFGNGAAFQPYERDDKLVRPWAIPGTTGLEHRIGGLEKEDATGNVSYDPINHERMVRIRAAKIAGIAQDIPPLTVHGSANADLLVVGWGGTYGAIRTAVEQAQQQGLRVAHAHFRYLNPLPANTGEVFSRYRSILVPELNSGQFRWLLQAAFAREMVGLNKIQGRPFLVSEIRNRIHELLADSGVR